LAQARVRDCRVDGLQIHGPAPRAAITDLARERSCELIMPPCGAGSLWRRQPHRGEPVAANASAPHGSNGSALSMAQIDDFVSDLDGLRLMKAGCRTRPHLPAGAEIDATAGSCQAQQRGPNRAALARAKSSIISVLLRGRAEFLAHCQHLAAHPHPAADVLVGRVRGLLSRQL
jgi:hypothetical protein